MLSKKQLIGSRGTNDSDLVVLIDESSIAGSSSMRKAMKNGPGSRGGDEDQDPNHG